MQLFNITTKNAGQALRKAVYLSQNPVFQSKLCTAISPDDAHAIDVKYHKSCWTEHVFHVLRDSGKESETNNYCMQQSMQNACFIELVNLIDLQTKNKAYLSIEDVEITYINLLGGLEALANHSPAYTRQWLKDKVMAELPSIRSVLQKDRRNAAVLYSPAACEADMVPSAIVTGEVDNMKCIYKSAQLIRLTINHFSKAGKSQGNITVSSTLDDVPAELYTLIHWI